MALLDPCRTLVLHGADSDARYGGSVEPVDKRAARQPPTRNDVGQESVRSPVGDKEATP
jgi:hypothetical protein